MIRQRVIVARNEQQDMALLIRVRNDVVHFKMEGKPPSYLKGLDQRGISLTAWTDSQDSDYVWPHKLSTSEGIRWAHNTACATIKALAYLARTVEHYRDTVTFLAAGFSSIPDSYPRDQLLAQGIEPYSDYP